jgi:hypothetical protein
MKYFDPDPDEIGNTVNLFIHNLLDGTVTIDYEKFGSKDEGLAYARELYQYLKKWQSERYDPSDDDYAWRDIMHWFYDAVFKARAYGALKGEFRYKNYTEEIDGLRGETEKLKNENTELKSERDVLVAKIAEIGFSEPPLKKGFNALG